MYFFTRGRGQKSPRIRRVESYQVFRDGASYHLPRRLPSFQLAALSLCVEVDDIFNFQLISSSPFPPSHSAAKGRAIPINAP